MLYVDICRSRYNLQLLFVDRCAGAAGRCADETVIGILGKEVWQGRETCTCSNHCSFPVPLCCRSGTLRSRLAAAIFEQIAEWNGWSRVMVPWSCGLHTSVKVHTSEEFHTSVDCPVETAGQGAGPGVQGPGQGQQGQQEQQGQQGEDEDIAQRTSGSDEMSKRAAVLTAGSSLVGTGAGVWKVWRVQSRVGKVGAVRRWCEGFALGPRRER